MKKKLSLLLAVCIILTLFATYTVADEGIENSIIMYVDSSLALVNNEECYIDEDKAVAPIVESGRTLVPVRFIAENLKMNVDYDEDNQLVTISNDDYNINFTIGSNVMMVNGEEKMIDKDNLKVIAKTVNDRTLIPMRSLAEAIGKKVFYDRGLIIISDKEDIFNAGTDKTALDNLITKVNVLPTVGSATYLTELIGSLNNGNYYSRGGGSGGIVFEDSKTTNSISKMPSNVPAPTAPQDSAKNDKYSQTNTQVNGVDEADIVKTDGEYLYQVNNQRIIITKVNPIEQMSITSVIKHETEQYNPYEIYVDGDKLIVLASVYKYDEPKVYDSANEKRIAPRYYINTNYTQLTVYNITDKASPKIERTLELEGNYLSSRKIGKTVYTVANKYLYYNAQPNEFATTYIENKNSINVGYDCVRYFPGFSSMNYLIIASVDISQPDKEATVETLLGGGENIYVSSDNMYVAYASYSNNSTKTNIFKFSLDNGNITFLKKGEVEGNILNQFSMDEYDGYFRVATTIWGNTQEHNSLFVLDETMTQCGSIEDIAPGERIYSTRFVGGRGYMVTFKQVDPLFAIDLSDPFKPIILGNLKIPGYSDYIHPIDENHIIGFGKDATNEGLYQGMKMAMFDVSDIEKPQQKFMEIIGDRGTESALLQNHKALLYAPELNLLAFPVTVREVTENNQYQTAYGQLTFSGAYVYNFDTEDGFKLKGKISHLSKEDILKQGDYVDYNKEISRILYAGNSLLSTSNSKVQAHSIDTVEFENSIDIPEK